MFLIIYITKRTPSFFATPLGRSLWYIIFLYFFPNKSVENGTRFQRCKKPSSRRRDLQQLWGNISQMQQTPVSVQAVAQASSTLIVQHQQHSHRPMCYPTCTNSDVHSNGSSGFGPKSVSTSINFDSCDSSSSTSCRNAPRIIGPKNYTKHG